MAVEDGQTPLAGRFPVVLGMTPYGRNGVCGCFAPDFFATRGMVGAAADVRGTGGSEGNLEGNFFSPREQRDGYNLVEYFGTQPYSTGKVGMAGGSYVGHHPVPRRRAAAAASRGDRPAVALGDIYRDAYTHGGIPNLSFDAQYIAVQGAPGAAGTNTDPYLLEETLSAKLGQSPPGTVAFDYLARPDDDPFYRDRSPIYRADRIEVPALIIGSWRDGLLRGAPEMYQRLARRSGVETRLYMDPCTHKGCGPPFAPLTDPPGRNDVAAVAFEFLQKHLQGAATPDRPPVQFYLQSRDQYVSAKADRWPPAGTKFKRFQLDASGLRPADEGLLPRRHTGEPELRDQSRGRLQHGLRPVRDRRGDAVHPDRPAARGTPGSHLPHSGPERPAHPGRADRPAPRRRIDRERHRLAREARRRRTGRQRVDHHRRCAARLTPRPRHRQSTPARPYHTHTNPQPIEPNRFYEYDIEIWPTAYELAPGHRLQLRLTSTDLPTHLPGSIDFDRDRPAGRAHRPAAAGGQHRAVRRAATWCCRSRNSRPATAPRTG